MHVHKTMRFTGLLHNKNDVNKLLHDICEVTCCGKHLSVHRNAKQFVSYRNYLIILFKCRHDIIISGILKKGKLRNNNRQTSIKLYY